MHNLRGEDTKTAGERKAGFANKSTGGQHGRGPQELRRAALRSLSTMFGWLGKTVARRPRLTIILYVLLTLGAGLGISVWKTEVRVRASISWVGFCGVALGCSGA